GLARRPRLLGHVDDIALIEHRAERIAGEEEHGGATRPIVLPGVAEPTADPAREATQATRPIPRPEEAHRSCLEVGARQQIGSDGKSHRAVVVVAGLHRAEHLLVLAHDRELFGPGDPRCGPQLELDNPIATRFGPDGDTAAGADWRI